MTRMNPMLSAFFQPAPPMFGAVPTSPQFQGPFNLQTGTALDMIAPMAGQWLMDSLGGRYNMAPGQFTPTQSYYDQITAYNSFNSRQEAFAAASQRDLPQLRANLGGMLRTMGGVDTSSPQGKQLVQQLASMGSNVLPVLAQAFGPENIDRYGSDGRGYASTMAMTMQRGLGTIRDPATGGPGLTGRSAGSMADELYAQLYGPGADVGALRGMSAAQAGSLYSELAVRGMGGQTMGSLSGRERLRTVAGMDLTDDEVSRAAQRSDYIRGIKDSGRDPTRDDFKKAEAQIRDTHNRLRKANLDDPNLDISAMSDLPGNEEMMRIADARKLTGRIKGLGGVVDAMKDVFGTLGKPNAPMAELVQGLDALTQGGLATMGKAQLEDTVRTISSVARSSGMGMERFIAMAAQGAVTADRLGVSRGLVPGITTATAHMGMGLQSGGQLERPVFDAKGIEELTLMDQQLRIQAAASPANAQLNAIMAMDDRGLIPKGSKLAAVAADIKAGRVSADMPQNRQQFMDLVTGSGVNADLARDIVNNRRANQEMDAKYGTSDVARQMQAKRDIEPKLGRGVGGSLARGFESQGINAALRGMGKTPAEIAAIAQQGGQAVAAEAGNLPPEIRDDSAKFEKALGEITEKALVNIVKARGGTDADVAAVRAAMSKTDATGVSAANQLGISAHAALDTTIQNDRGLHGFINYTNYARLNDNRNFTEANRHKRETQARVAMATALGGLGQKGAMQRFWDAVASAKPGDFGKVFARALGLVDQDEIAKQHPAVQALYALGENWRGAERNDKGELTERGKQQQAWAVTEATGLAKGGAEANKGLQAVMAEYGVKDENQLEGVLEAKINDPKASAKEKDRARRSLKLAQALRVARDDKQMSLEAQHAQHRLPEMGLTEEAEKQLAAEATDANKPKDAKDAPPKKPETPDKAGGQKDDGLPKEQKISGTLTLLDPHHVMLNVPGRPEHT